MTRPMPTSIHARDASAAATKVPVSRRDDMEQFRKEILEADMMVFVTPLYYYGMSAQLKILIDRFSRHQQQHYPEAY